MAAEKKDYTVAVAGFFYGKHYAIGARLRLTDGQAKYEKLQGNIKDFVPLVDPPSEPVEVAAPKGAPRKRRVTESTR